MITVHTRHSRTREETEHHFKTELGAYEHVRTKVFEHTNMPMSLATDVANLLVDKKFIVTQKKLGPLFFTVHRSRA